MRSLLLVLLIAAAVCSATGCATVVYEAHGSNPVLLSGQVAGAQHSGRTEGGGMKLWIIWWLIAPGGEEVDDIQDLAHTGGGVQNLEIHEYYGFLDIVVNALVGGLINTLHEEYKADVITVRRGT